VTELLGYDGHRDAAHRQRCAVCVAQDVKGNGWRDLGPFASVKHRAALVRLAPQAVVVPREYWTIRRLAGGKGRKVCLPFLRQRHVPRLIRLGCTHCHHARLGVEICDLQSRQFRIAAASKQCATNEISIIRIASIR
jgi:hypothetical protein